MCFAQTVLVNTDSFHSHFRLLLSVNLFQNIMIRDKFLVNVVPRVLIDFEAARNERVQQIYALSNEYWRGKIFTAHLLSHFHTSHHGFFERVSTRDFSTSIHKIEVDSHQIITQTSSIVATKVHST
jgi:hypothetical protein